MNDDESDSSSSDEEENVLDPSRVQLVNRSNVAKSSTASNIRAATNHFQRYLQYENIFDTIRSTDDIAAEEPELIDHLGKFSHYLMEIVPTVKKVKTHLNLLIPIFQQMLDRLIHAPSGTREKFHNGYSKLRKQTNDYYINKANETGEDIVDHTTVGEMEHFIFIFWVLFCEKQYEMLAIAVFDFQSLGRISETKNCRKLTIKLIDLLHSCERGSFKIRGLQMKWMRGKTGISYNMIYLMNWKYPFACPIVALGLWQRSETGVTDDALFHMSSIPSNMNKTLKRIEQLWNEWPDTDVLKPQTYKQGLQAHSFRASPYTFLTSTHGHGRVEKGWVDCRTGFNQNKTETSSNYFGGTLATDRSCALRLSQWPNAHEGGICPSIDALPAGADRARFKEFVDTFFFLSLNKVQVGVLELLAIVLVFWYGQYCASSSCYYYEMEAFSDLTNCQCVDHEMLLSWSADFVAQFNSLNGNAIPNHMMSASDVQCPASTLADIIDSSNNVVSLIRTVAAESELNSRHITALAHRVDDLSEKVVTMHAATNEKLDALLALFTQSGTAVLPRRRTFSTMEDASIGLVGATSLVQQTIPRSLGIITHPNEAFQVPKSVADLVAWYCRNIFAINCVGRAKDAFEKCKKLIGYLKHFMVEGTVIERGSTTSNQVFVGRISTLAKVTEHTLKAFLLVPSIASTWSKSSKPPTLSHCTVEATYKKLTYIYSNHRALFPPHRAIVDNITPPEHTVLY